MMKKAGNQYLNNIPKYEIGTYSRYYNSTKYSNNSSSKNINCYDSSEDEKTNSKSNNFLSDKNRNIISKYNPGKKISSNIHQLSNSQRLLNDNEYRNTIPENFHSSNQAFNPMTEGKNINNTIPNNFGNSLKIESDKKNSDRSFHHFIKHNSHHALNYNDNFHTQHNINKKSNDKNIKRHNFYLSDKLIEYESNTNKSYRVGKVKNIINEEIENRYNSKWNSSRTKNQEMEKENEKNKNIIYNKNNINILEKTSKERRENNLSLNIKKSNNIQNILNINKKNVITTIPNNNNKKNNNLSLYKKSELNASGKLHFINFSNLSNLNESSQKTISDKNNHSFYEVKSLSKDFGHQRTDILISEAKKLYLKNKNNNSVLNLSSKKNSKFNSKKYNNTTNSINNEKISRTKNNFFTLEEKKEIKETKYFKDIKFNLREFNKYIIKESKNNIMPKENKKLNSDILNNVKINNEKNYKINDKFIFNKDKIKIGNLQIKKLEKKNNLIKIKNDYKISQITNKRKNAHIESFIRRYKYNLNKINSNSFNYIPKIKEEKVKNKKFVTNKNLLMLKNLNYKTFEEDFPLKIKSYKRYKLNKNLKPQISVRITLFNIDKPERKRYFFVNFFYSENIRNPILIESDF